MAMEALGSIRVLRFGIQGWGPGLNLVLFVFVALGLRFRGLWVSD